MSGIHGLDERYFDWLCELIGAKSSRDPEKSYVLLAEQMFKVPFDDSTPNDFNRALDGKDLRTEFLDETKQEANEDWLNLECSMLEMLIALARRLSFQTDWAVDSCFWLMITNLELHKYTDDRFNDGIAEAVLFVIDMVNERTYDYSGRGGIFPLKAPPEDQRKIEIWYQMMSYLLEEFEY